MNQNKVCCLDCLNFHCKLKLVEPSGRMALSPKAIAYGALGKPFSLIFSFKEIKAQCVVGRLLGQDGKDKVWILNPKNSWKSNMEMSRKRKGLNHDHCDEFESDEMEVTHG